MCCEHASDDGLGVCDGVGDVVGVELGVGVPLPVGDWLEEKHTRPPAKAHWPSGHAPLMGPLFTLPAKHSPVCVQ